MKTPVFFRPMHAPRLIYWILAGAVLFFSFARFPPTKTMDTPQQSWEPVLGYAGAHHLQWGHDIVYTYGPLGFMVTDDYWGYGFVPIMVWAMFFAILLTAMLLRGMTRMSLPFRIGLCLVLPWLTVPRRADLGVDPIYLFAIMLFSVGCLPSERVGVGLLILLGSVLGLIGLVKFTFCVYSLLALFLVLCAHVLHRQFRRGVVLFFSAISVFLATWLVLEQDVSNIVPWFRYSWQIAVGYADALAFPPDWSALVLALFIWVGLLSLLVLHLRSVPAVLPEMPRVLLIVAGVFFAWKEGFVQAEEYHLGVFFVWASLTAAAMPVLLPADCERPRRFLSVTLLTLGCAMASFFGPEEGYLSAIRDGAGQRFKDTFSAVFTPVHYKHQLEVHLDSRRNTARLPDIAAIAGDSSMAVLSYYQDVAILNGFNYKPHPVFQNYSAYTPDLQKLNAAFYASTNLPDFVLWPYLTVGNRFPSLDDGIIILSVLNHYIPVRYEKSHVLWQRRTNSAASFHLIPDAEGNVALDEWIPIPRQATWLTVEIQHTWHEQLKAFFFQPSFPAIEVQLEDGTTRTFFLMRGYARSGFVVNPLLAIAPDLVLPALNRGRPMRVVAARIFARNGRFRNTIHYTTSIIEGVPALDAPLPSSDAQPFPDLAPATVPSRPQ